MISLSGLFLLSLATVSRFVLSPLFYFLVSVAAYIVFTVLRKRHDYYLILIAPVIPVFSEAAEILVGNFRVGFLIGSIVCIITALLGLGEERPKEKMIRRLGLPKKTDRGKVVSLFYTFGRVERIEKVNMSQSYAIVYNSSFHFTVNIPGSGQVNMEIPLEDIEEVAVHQSTSSSDLYYPSLRDMFLPARNIRQIGKSKIKDYFLVIRVADDSYSFYEEPLTVLRLQEEIERERDQIMRK